LAIENKELAERAIECAKRSIGVREDTKPNWGKWVSVYLKFVGILFPAPWCSAFVSYKIHQAAQELGVKTIWPKQAYVQSVVNWAKKRPEGSIRTGPLPNSVFVKYDHTLKRYAHIGFIADVKWEGGQEKILTVEGNSNTDGSREGKEVVSKWRVWTKDHRCIRIV